MSTLRKKTIDKASTVFARQNLTVFLLFLAFAVLLQWLAGAYHADFGDTSDEAAHYVTGLMVRDFVANHHFTSPLRFAENYYIHYPQVAFGHWPPFFYVLQSMWTLLFSPTRISVLLLMAALTAFLAIAVCAVVRTEFGTKAGIAAGVLLISLPLTQMYTGTVMAEVPVALFSFLAAVSFGQYLESEKWQDAVLFGLLASVAILTKGNAFSLAFVPPFALLLSRRFHLLARASFWYPILIVGILCGPWQILTQHMVQAAWGEQFGAAYTLKAVSYYSRELVKALGVGLIVLAAIGFIVRIIKPFRTKEVHGKWAAAGALVLSVLIFQLLVPTGVSNRYLITAFPALAMFVVAGITWLSKRLSIGPFSVQQRAAGLACLAALVYIGATFAIPPKHDHGLTRVAQDLLARPEFKNSVFMIGADQNEEGAFIAEVAMLEQRPSHFIVRGYKVLTRNHWVLEPVDKPIFQTSEEIKNFLDQIPVGILVLDMSPRAQQAKHNQQLLQMVKDYPQQWQQVSSFPGLQLADSSSSPILVYRQLGQENRPIKIKLNMEYMLNRSLEN